MLVSSAVGLPAPSSCSVSAAVCVHFHSPFPFLSPSTDMHLYSIAVCRVGDDVKEAVRATAFYFDRCFVAPQSQATSTRRSDTLKSGVRHHTYSTMPGHPHGAARAVLIQLFYTRLCSRDVHLLRPHLCHTHAQGQSPDRRLSGTVMYVKWRLETTQIKSVLAHWAHRLVACGSMHASHELM